MNYIKKIMIEVQNCVKGDSTEILALYEAARKLQMKREMVVWPAFEASFIEQEIAEKRQWKIVVDGVIVCNWAITFEDKEIWEDKDQGDGVYIHRICNNPNFRGQRYIDTIAKWGKSYAKEQKRPYARLDTLGKNTKLIKHYTSAGFDFLGIFHLKSTEGLPAHYQNEKDCCLFEMKVY